MKKISIALAIFAALCLTVSCDNRLDVVNPNNQTTYDFGRTEADLNEAIISCYNRIRLEGTYSRVGYTMDAVRGDEVWNSSQIWYLPYDNLNAANTDEIGCLWMWRDAFHVVNRCNFVISKLDEINLAGSGADEIRGQALFLRALAYYELSTYYQNVPLYTKYEDYSSLETIYAPCAPQDEVFDQIEADLVEAMELLPSRDKGGEWAKGRATCGAAAGYYARALMFRHKFSEALEVLEDIMSGTYGQYKLMADYGDNFREGTAYENNAESLFEVQFLDYGMGGTDEEWTPVNISKNSTQGHAVESNYGSGELGSWGDLAISPWLYNLFKDEKCTDGTLDPRLYWTVVSYEPEYSSYTGAKTAAYPNGDPRSNIVYMNEITTTPLANTQNGGVSIAKFTNARNNIYSTIVTGLHCGVNLRLMRYSDVLLRAAECENELNGPTAKAIEWINQVRRRVALPELNLSDFGSADKLFEQIANVERPKEFGCENGRGIDLIRWGFFYDSGRLDQIKQHSCFMLDGTASTVELTTDTASDYSYKYYSKGHEYFPIFQGTLNANPNLTGNSANTNTDNGEAFRAKGWTVRPVVQL
ncbi:MAG: RagB/SusD family nutrient uptake outer membrane protein [Bacteroidales bacterium]|nr:RagB/SusD family nutrient uptake outer membrane protein [Candidatus Hennigimonas equi]